jgi:uncharacterized repeat protein (TIGR01451 family)
VKLRRVLGTLLAFAVLTTTLLVPQPASAETLNLNILDPTEPSASSPSGFLGTGFTGVGNFDATSFDGVNNAGTDSSAHNHIVRTNDTIGYDFNFNLLGGGGTNIVLTATLSPAGAGKWIGAASLPCPGGATVSPDGSVLTCTYGVVGSGVQDLLASAQMIATPTANGQHIEVSATISDGPGNSVTRVGYTQSTGVDALIPDDIITSSQKAQLVKATSAIPQGTIAHVFNHNNTGINGYLVTYPILVREGNGTSGNAKLGNAPLPSTFTFNDNVVAPAGASIDACGVNGDGVVTISKAPFGTVNGTTHTTTNSTINSGMITCGALAGGVVQVTVTGADTSGTTYPTIDADNATQVEDNSWVVSGYLRLFVPDDNMTHHLTDIYVPDANFTGQTPSNGSCVLGDPGLQLCSSADLPIYTPTLSGAGNKTLIQDVLGGTPHGFSGTSNANGPALNPSQEFVAQITQQNPSNATTTGLANLQNAVSCDALDTSKETIWAFDGTTGTADPTHAVLIDGSSTATIAAIQYGDASSNCSDAYGVSAHWTTTIDMSNAAAANYYLNIHNVRVLYEIDAETSPTPNQFLKFYVNEKTLATDNPGDIVSDCNATVADIFYQGSVTGTFHSGNCGQGQIFYSNYNIAKALRADISNTALFTVLGHAHPGVDPSQEFVGYLQIDGHLNTIVQHDTYACDLIDQTKYTVADFDGTTNPSTPITGPVTFLTGSHPNLNGSPANLTFSSPNVPALDVEYSTDALTGSDNCQTGTWSTTEPPAATITKIRIHWDLQINQSVMMLVNLKANAGLMPFGSPTPDTITNTMAASTLALPAPPLNASATAEVLSEVVQLTKTVTPGSEPVGGTVTYTLVPTLFGPATTSGSVSISDTLPAGLTYHPASAQFTNLPPPQSTWNTATGSATPMVTTDPVTGIQTLVFTVGTAGAAPGRFVALPSIQFQADTSIALPNGAITNHATILDMADTSGANHMAQASFNITGSGGLNVRKIVTLAPTAVNTPIDWELQYSNQSGTSDLPWTDFIDIMPFNGDSLGTHYNGTLTFASVTASDPVTFEYTNQPRNQINLDPYCATNGGSHGTSIVAGNPGAVCSNFSTTTWYTALGQPGGPQTAADVTAIRVLGGVLTHGSAVIHTIDIATNTSGNVPSDLYWNQYDLRTTNTLVAQAQVSTSVPIPPSPFVTLVKSCISPANCTTAAQPTEGAAAITDIVYQIQATNAGGHAAGTLTITDAIPNSGGPTPTFYMDFKVGSATMVYTGAFNAGMFTVTYSSDPLVGNGSFTYTPISGGGGAPVGYDRMVTAVRWTMNSPNTLPAAGGSNVGTVQFSAAIR